MIGWVIAGWGFISAMAGLAFGAIQRPIGVSWLLVGMGLTTMPLALTPSPWAFAGTLMVAGLFVAPSLVGAVDELQRVVPARFRGQAMGWQGTAMMIGNATAPPLVGAVMDARGWQAGFLVAGGLAALLGLALLGSVQVRRRVRASRTFPS